MRKLWQWWGLVLALGVTGAGAEEVPLIDNAGSSYCINEANDAMWLGRMVMAFQRNRAEIESDQNIPPYVRAMADELFRVQAAGEAKTYAHFALRRFKSCLASQKVALPATDIQMFTCLTRVDIPFFFRLMQQSGETPESASVKLEEMLAGWHYPPGLVRLFAQPSFKAQGAAEIRSLQLFLLRSCLLPPADVGRYYGIPTTEAEAGAAAPGKGVKAKP